MFVARRMKKLLVTAAPSASLFEAQRRMREHTIRQLPVVSEDGTLLGVGAVRGARARGLTPGAGALGAFIAALGVGEVPSRLEVVVPDRPGTLAQLSAIIGSFHVNITSVLSTRHVEGGKGAKFFPLA